MEAYFTAFEAHMESYSLTRNLWNRHLVPVFPPEATQVYVVLDTDIRQDYNTHKTALFSHYRITRETYRQRMDQLRRKSEETWNTCGRRHLNLTMKWGECHTTAKEWADLVSTEAIISLMPKQMATYM